MTCSRKGDKLYAIVGGVYMTVYFVKHDRDKRSLIHVAWPGTRHISRVPKYMLRKPKKRRRRSR